MKKLTGNVENLNSLTVKRKKITILSVVKKTGVGIPLKALGILCKHQKIEKDFQSFNMSSRS